MAKKKTFLQKATSTYSEATLSDFQIKLEKGNQDIPGLDGEDVKQLVCFSPSSQGLFGPKSFNDYYHINNANTNRVIQDLISGLDISNDHAIFFGSNRKGKSSSKKPAEVRPFRKNFIYLKVESSIMVSLYDSIRNSLAHGDFILIRNNIYFFCFNRMELTNPDIEKRKLSFLLCQKESAKKLCVYHQILSQYKRLGEKGICLH